MPLRALRFRQGPQSGTGPELEREERHQLRQRDDRLARPAGVQQLLNRRGTSIAGMEHEHVGVLQRGGQPFTQDCAVWLRYAVAWPGNVFGTERSSGKCTI